MPPIPIMRSCGGEEANAIQTAAYVLPSPPTEIPIVSLFRQAILAPTDTLRGFNDIESPPPESGRPR
jgi:hypothetical protein